MKLTYSDEEIEKMLENVIEIEQINLDERIFDYWLRDHTGRPVQSVDFKYARYVVRTWGYGDSTDDYWVMDIKNPFFRPTLEEFLEMDEKGILPVEVTKEQVRLHRKREIQLVSYVAMVIALFCLLLYFINP